MAEPTFPPTNAPAPKTGGAQGYLRIATEEAFATPEIIKLWLGLLDDPSFDDPGFRSLWSFYGTSTAERPRFILEHLQDLGDKRLKAMDDAGIDRAILSLTSPGAQPLKKDVAREQATLANDRLAEAIKKHPGRFSGLTGTGTYVFHALYTTARDVKGCTKIMTGYIETIDGTLTLTSVSP